MPFSLPPRFSFSPLLALVPGLMMLTAFLRDGVTPKELLLSGLMLAAGAVWSGFRGSRELVQPTEKKLDISLASAVLDALPDPVMLLDHRRRVLAHNLAASDALGVEVRERDLCLIVRQPEAQRAIRDVCAHGVKREMVEIVFEAPMRRVFQLQAIAVPSDEMRTIRAIVAMHEITALKAAEDMRADFVANVSHELRSPLSTVTGFIETLQTVAKDDPAAQERFLGIMAGEAGRMSRLIDDLLSLSKIETNEHIRPQGRVDVAEIMRAVLDAVAVKAQKKGVTIDIDMAHNLPTVSGDDDELHQVFENLIENAIKYGVDKDGGTIAISARAVDKISEIGKPGIEVRIQDFGEGISPQHLPRLTERFYRVDKGRSRALGGTGLGLAIVKHIVNRHRGRMTVESELKKGTTFCVQLPAENITH